ncbi:MAG: bifunctional aspartate kinase/homoserine dehydrogenase I [Flavobacteriaceae bacterium]|nr:bifunctional aspartate kinase/homoserine dehydrogenase I [Flavobacteriaceae bacterium]
MKIIKFGGKSLANGQGIENVISIIKNKVNLKEKIIIVLSARGNATDCLELILDKAKNGEDYAVEWKAFKEYQIEPNKNIDYHKEFTLLEKTFEGVKLVEDYSLKVKDLVLAQGELLAAKMIASLLNQNGIKSNSIDSRDFLKTNDNFGNAQIIEKLSKTNTVNWYNAFDEETIPIVTGFITSNKNNQTTTLGRNGSNYSASLIAKYLNASEVQNYTHIDGIYTANPDYVSDAKIIEQLNFNEASELASFGASILHAKTIIPLVEKNIPLRILNTYNPNATGTLINNKITDKEVKSISVQNEIGFINIEGKGLLGKKGIDARIFSTMNQNKISVSVISQGSSERSIGFIISEKDIKTAVNALKIEFQAEIQTKDISSIISKKEVSVITIIGQNINNFSSSFNALIKNNIDILLINNTLNGNNIGLVIDNKNVNKAINVIHSQIFGISKNINIAIFGKGTVGGALINQILNSKNKILKRKEINLNIFAIAGSKKILLNKEGISNKWKEEYDKAPNNNKSITDIIEFAQKYHFENLIAIDNTASTTFIDNYIPLAENGFDLISSNKIANTQSYLSYKKLRESLKKNNKNYLYETNVGAGLPLIDTINILHASGENITRIKGVFSGSLSFIFNHFSESESSFSDILQQAIDKGLTEPDPREDLCGNDVARKLLILARELDLQNEFNEIKIHNLIPTFLQDESAQDFLSRIEELNPVYQKIKEDQKEKHVLRYIGDLSGDLQKNKGSLEVKLISVPEKSSLGQLNNADSIFEIYTESYGDNPIVIQGAGAGAEVTARGVFGDLLRITERK